MNNLLIKILAHYARSIFKRFRPYVIGVTGSSGKTTTKVFVSEFLKSSGADVRVSTANMNTEYSLPLAVLGFEKSPKTAIEWIWIMILATIRAIFTYSYPKYLVLEFAADKPGDIKYLTTIIKPDLSIITNIGVAHLEKFKTIETIAKEKWTLAQQTKDKIITTKEVMDRVKSLNSPQAEIIVIPTRKITIKKKSELMNGFELEISVSQKKDIVKFPLFGEHNLIDLELALNAAFIICGDATAIIKAIPDLKSLPGRGKRFIGINDVLVIDESYNANPISMFAALESFKNVKYERKVAILGEMLEIGSISKASHQKIAQYAKKVADYTVGVGDGFKDQNLDKWYPNVRELEKDLNSIVKKDDAVLIKGSLSNNLKLIVDKLR